MAGGRNSHKNQIKNDKNEEEGIAIRNTRSLRKGRGEIRVRSVVALLRHRIGWIKTISSFFLLVVSVAAGTKRTYARTFVDGGDSFLSTTHPLTDRNYCIKKLAHAHFFYFFNLNV